MFESDDYDQILSQLDLPEPSKTQVTKTDQDTSLIFQSVSDSFGNPLGKKCSPPRLPQDNYKENSVNRVVINKTTDNADQVDDQTFTKHNKRKLINTYFDHKTKRKFPGPAGLLNGTFEESKDDIICHVELLSQDIDYSQSCLHKGIFESPLWTRLLQDTKDLNKVDTIRVIKQHALKGNLRRRKADAIIAVVESIDRSAIDPQIVVRDTTESIKCTLHRDAWVAFSPYIASECCALVLQNPTVLTTGSAFKKHYLNITLSNIHAVYSTAIIKLEETFPVGFTKVYEDDYTIIKNEKQQTGSNIGIITQSLDESSLLDGLDGVFSDEIF